MNRISAGARLFTLDDDAAQARLRKGTSRAEQDGVLDTVHVELDVVGIRKLEALHHLIEREAQDRLAVHGLERRRVAAAFQRMQSRAGVEAAVVEKTQSAFIGECDIHRIDRRADTVQSDIAAELRKGRERRLERIDLDRAAITLANQQ